MGLCPMDLPKKNRGKDKGNCKGKGKGKDKGKGRLRKDQPRKLMKMMMQPTMTSCKGKGKGKGKSKGRLRKDQPRILMKMMMQPTMTSQITSTTMSLTNHHQLTKQDILLDMLLYIHNSNIVTYHFISASKFLHIKSVQ